VSFSVTYATRKAQLLYRLTSGLNDRGVEVLVMVDERLTGSGVHPAPTPCVQGSLSPGIKQPGREAYHYLPISVGFKNMCVYSCIPPICIYGAVLNLFSIRTILLYLYPARTLNSLVTLVMEGKIRNYCMSYQTSVIVHLQYVFASNYVNLD
jgi:hypothetical protein